MHDDQVIRHIHDHVRRTLDRVRAHLDGGAVVAVSGGGDSVALLRIVHTIAPDRGLSLTVAHFDHGARPDSADDARFVADLAAALGLPFEMTRWTPPRSTHFEADARKARYAWLDAVTQRVGAGAVLVGHTRDDQAETILHRILRGTGPRGLAGMPACRKLSNDVVLLRPLLGLRRDELRTYLRAVGQPYREDPTNADTSRTRSRIRHELLPHLAEVYNPRVVDALTRLGGLMRAADRGPLRSLSALERAHVVHQDADSVRLDRSGLALLPSSTRIELLRHVWRERRWPERDMNEARWRRLGRIVGFGKSGRILLPSNAAPASETSRTRVSVGGGIDLILTPDTVHLFRARMEKAPTSDPPPSSPLPVPGEVRWGDWRLVATLDDCPPPQERIDLDAVHLPLEVGPARAGETFAPLGMSGHSKPLREFLRARGVPPERRGSIPVVRDARGIVWVAGHRIADRVRLTDATTDTLGLRCEAIRARGNPEGERRPSNEI